MSPADVLDKAADLIEKRGLNQDGNLYALMWNDGKCALCTMAAVMSATKDDGEVREARLAIQSVLPQGRLVTSWSDATPQPEVVATLRKVAADLRATP